MRIAPSVAAAPFARRPRLTIEWLFQLAKRSELYTSSEPACESDQESGTFIRGGRL